jgi:hypothetical protein
MTTATIPVQLAADITASLSRLRIARQLYPEHVSGRCRTYLDCELCLSQFRLDRLMDRINRPKT